MIKPVRIQLKRERGWRLQAISYGINGLPAAKVDRSTPWGNPFPVSHHGRALAAEMFRTYLLHEQNGKLLLSRARVELAGRNLACWCPPGEPCHVDVWLEMLR